jgi:hypothetical protein
MSEPQFLVFECISSEPFEIWNICVRGNMAIRELMELLGREHAFDEAISRDEDGRLTQQFGRLGNRLLAAQEQNGANGANNGAVEVLYVNAHEEGTHHAQE